MSNTVFLISCTKSKQSFSCTAEEMYKPSALYSSALKYALNHVEDKHKQIFILSAKYGLLKLSDQISPYDLTLKNMSQNECNDWGQHVFRQLQQTFDMNNTNFVFLAGMSYTDPLRKYLPHYSEPLKGMPQGIRMQWLQENSSTPNLSFGSKPQTKDDICLKLHKLFNSMPQFRYDTIHSIGFDNGIYILFEKGETYQGFNRIVRVGTHRSDNRLRARLKDHFIKKNKDGSIFRKNIGRALLNKVGSNYLSVWNLDSSVKGFADNRYDAKIEKIVEDEISKYFSNNFYFICFPVQSSEERLRLEEGIIATLNTTADFKSSANWFGNNSPEHEIVNSGMWLKQGLDGIPLFQSEYITIERYCLGLPVSVNSTRIASNIPVKSVTPLTKVSTTPTSRAGVGISDVISFISKKLTVAKIQGAKSIVIVSGEIHSELGLVSRMPTVCDAMYKLMKASDIIHYAPPKGKGSRLKIEYFL